MRRRTVSHHRWSKGLMLGLAIAAGYACAPAQARDPEALYRQKLEAAYDLIAAAPFNYSDNEIDVYGEAALSRKGDERLYALWRVLYAYKTNQNEAKLTQWHDRIVQQAVKDNDSNLDLLARFMKQAYDNETKGFVTLQDRDWAAYMAAPDRAIQEIVTLEHERKLQYDANWAEAIDQGDSLVTQVQMDGARAEGLLSVAQQVLAYNMIQVGDYDAYADHVLAMARLSRGNIFSMQKMDLLYDLATFAAQDDDAPLAQKFQQLYARNVETYHIADLRPWNEELCAVVNDKAENYGAVIGCLKDSNVMRGEIATTHDAFTLRMLIRAYAHTGDSEKARYYLARSQTVPTTIYPRDMVFEDNVNAWLLAGEGRHREAFRALSDWATKSNRRSDNYRVAAVRDMYQTLRKELDRKNAEGRILNRQVQMGQLLLGAAVLIAMLLAVIVAGGALWAVRMRRMQWHLKDAHDQAEAANAAKSRFLAVMSHELRTPLNGVLGMAQALKKEDLTDGQREQVEILVDSGQTLLTLLNDVLDMSRIEAGKVELAPTPANMRDMVERVINTYSTLLGGKDVALRYDLSETAEKTMSFDVLRVYQCLSNLVSNALKFTEKGSVRIHVTAEPIISDMKDESGYLVRVEVRDTGIGMSRATLDKLFDAYAQADAGITRRYGGSGLGLSISKRLSELMGGGLSASSVEGEGSSFVMTFRAGEVAQAAPEAVVPAPAAPAEDKTMPGLRILLVDDHPVNRKVARLFLEPFGFIIFEAADGEEALSAGMANFDLVLMDLNMPKMGGLEATRIFRAGEAPDRHVPIVALTADAMQDQIDACLAAGMDGHISKPILMDKLIETVTDMLQQHQPERFEQAMANAVQ